MDIEQPNIQFCIKCNAPFDYDEEVSCPSCGHCQFCGCCGPCADPKCEEEHI